MRKGEYRTITSRGRTIRLRAIKQIEATDPALASHLAATIRTGTFCSYIPDPRAPPPPLNNHPCPGIAQRTAGRA
jgi:hypothetical protein